MHPVETQQQDCGSNAPTFYPSKKKLSTGPCPMTRTNLRTRHLPAAGWSSHIRKAWLVSALQIDKRLSRNADPDVSLNLLFLGRNEKALSVTTLPKTPLLYGQNSLLPLSLNQPAFFTPMLCCALFQIDVHLNPLFLLD